MNVSWAVIVKCLNEGRRAYLRLHEERNAKVNGISAHNVVNVLSSLSTLQGKVENTTDIVLLEDLTEGTLIIGGELNDFDLDVALARLLEVGLDVLAGGVELVAHGGEVVDDLGEPLLVDFAAKEQTFAGLGHAEVHGGLERGPVGLDEVFTEAGDFAGGGHFHPQEGVGAGESSP